MTKKILELLRELSGERKDVDLDVQPEDLVEALEFENADIEDIAVELREVEDSNRFSDHELDILKAVLVYILIKEGIYHKEDVFSLVFNNGSRILWN